MSSCFHLWSTECTIIQANVLTDLCILIVYKPSVHQLTYSNSFEKNVSRCKHILFLLRSVWGATTNQWVFSKYKSSESLIILSSMMSFVFKSLFLDTYTDSDFPQLLMIVSYTRHRFSDVSNSAQLIRCFLLDVLTQNIRCCIWNTCIPFHCHTLSSCWKLPQTWVRHTFCRFHLLSV